jgi:hypothetical protein
MQIQKLKCAGEKAKPFHRRLRSGGPIMTIEELDSVTSYKKLGMDLN